MVAISHLFQWESASVDRYFFDVVGHGRSDFDYAGRVLPTPERAYDAAESIAYDLAVRGEDAIGWAVNVCSIEGRRLFSIPVLPSYLAAI
jgi:hypothetical protein